MNKYTIEVKELNPMETAPVWGYYSGYIEAVILFYINYDGLPENTIGYYDRNHKVWKNH